MIRRCLAEDAPFGVALIQTGVEVGAAAEPHTVGTVARIIESSHLPDGTMNIVTVGTERFRIHRLIHDQPYLRGEVEIFPLDAPDDLSRLHAMTSRVREQVQDYIALIAEAAGLQIQIEEIPEASEQLGYLAAVALQVDNREKQALLGSASMTRILAGELALLNRENMLLTWMTATKDWPGQVQFGPSGTLLPN